MKTITFDASKWQLVPVEPTREMKRAAQYAELHIRNEDRCEAAWVSGWPAMLAAAPPPPAAEPWQPIETAPKDGTMILAPLPGSDIWHAVYFGDRKRSTSPNKKSAICWRMGWDHSVIPDHDTPKQWMPQPPTTGEAS